MKQDYHRSGKTMDRIARFRHATKVQAYNFS